MSGLLAVLKTIHAAVSFLNSLIAHLRERRAVAAGEDRAAARSLKEQMTRVEKARAARRAVDLGRLPDDDPYRRD